MNKFLIIQTASIGDVILATPVIEKLHHHFPEAKIDFLLKKGNESLFESHPFIHQVMIWDKSSDKYKNFWGLINYIRDKKYDCVINVQRFASSGLMTVYSGAKLKIGFNKNPFSFLFNKRVKHTIRKGNRHETERNLDLVRIIADDTAFPVKLYPSQHDYAKMSQYKTVKYICISPASLWFTKQYPKEKWIEFINEIDKELRIYFLGSKNDYEICEEIIKISRHINSLNLSGKLSFLESAALMKDAKMNYMNDSAPMHLASAVNAHVTAIFCSTVPSFGFGPLSDDSVVVETNEKPDCKPCGLHGLKKCPEKHFRCALTINTSDLLERL
ncbi:MAG: glycosyltransferase family 9 protein [Bacteroidetes bacterium]|nr:glycosyltransferase family 9 protein [Bacteroidota bacterium]MBL7105074.1 glycosyltransferase family 9 protein [Bacteroidales bacterium]